MNLTKLNLKNLYTSVLFELPIVVQLKLTKKVVTEPVQCNTWDHFITYPSESYLPPPDTQYNRLCHWFNFPSEKTKGPFCFVNLIEHWRDGKILDSSYSTRSEPRVKSSDISG